MGWTKKYKLMATVGKYTGNDGQEKRQYHLCGHELVNDKGTCLIKIDSLPVLFDGWLAVFDIEDRREPPQQAPQTNQNHTEDDDLPF